MDSLVNSLNVNRMETSDMTHDLEGSVRRGRETWQTEAPTIRLTVGQAVIRFLTVQYSSRDGQQRRLVPGMYGIFGHGNTGGLGQAIAELEPGEMFFLEGRNEQAMVHAAAAFAREHRRLSTLACTSSIGPGALNMITAAAGAQINRLPVLLLPSDEYMDRRQGTILQGLEHPRAGDVTVNDCFRPVARYFDRVSRPEQLVTALPAAMRVLTSPEDTGPVVLCLPQDVQCEAFDFPSDLFQPHVWNVDRPVADPDSIAAAAQLIRAAKRPLIIAGGGVVYSAAEAELRRFAERLALPVAETYSGKGVLAERSWRNLGGLGVEGTTPANTAARDADLVICAGTRLADFVSGAQSLFQNPNVRFVGLNIARADASKQGAVSVCGDLRSTLRQLDEQIPERLSDPEHQLEVGRLVTAWHRDVVAPIDDHGEGLLSQPELIRIVNAESGAGSVVIAAAGTLPGEILRLWDTANGSRCHLEFGFSCMGYEIPAGIGAAIARTSRRVVVLVGDGTFLLNPGEIVSAVQHRIPVTYVVSANGGMHSIHRLESALVQEPFANLFRYRDPWTRALAEEPLPLDLEAIAAGLGAKARSACNAVEVRDALRGAADDPGVHVIVVTTDPTRYLARTEVWHDIPPAAASNHPAINSAREEYDMIRAARQRRYM
jgi:3D-(3,5/4)-trihydroxycyclohexane-1,2-dione acylhydrolase (decyclizing)